MADLILKVALGIGATTFLAAFFFALYFTVRVLTATGALIETVEDKRAGLGERQGRSNSRFNAFLVRPEFRSLRRRYFWAWGTAIAAFLYVGVLVAIFENAK